MDNFFNYNYLLIDKQNDEFYFQYRKDIAKYLDIKLSQVNAIIQYCRKHYCVFHPKRKVFIQQLFNNNECNQMSEKNKIFIWDNKDRRLYWRKKDKDMANASNFGAISNEAV